MSQIEFAAEVSKRSERKLSEQRSPPSPGLTLRSPPRVTYPSTNRRHHRSGTSCSVVSFPLPFKSQIRFQFQGFGGGFVNLSQTLIPLSAPPPLLPPTHRRPSSSMVKSYLRYEPALTFGVIASLESHICHAPSPSSNLLLAPAIEAVAVWDLRKGTRTAAISHSARSSHSLAVTALASFPSSPAFSSGHTDGSVRLWNLPTASCEVTLNGHKSAATALRYSPSGGVLASDSKDCDVILWDVVVEAGLFQLRGHRDQCVQIMSGNHSEIWSLDVVAGERYLVVGSADPELRVYSFSHESVEPVVASKWEVLMLFGEIQRQTKDRVATYKDVRLLACQAAGRTVEVFNVLDDSEAKREAKRRLHRKREKASAKASEGNENGSLTGIEPLVVVVSDIFKLLPVLRASKKISSAFSPIAPAKGGLSTLSLSLNNNMLENYLAETDKISKTRD